MKNIFLLSILLFVLSACNKNLEKAKYAEVWFPIYGDTMEAKTIETLPARPLISAGKIYIYQDYFFQIDKSRGIHVYQFTDKTLKSISYIKVFGVEDMAIRNDLLYVNNLNDLIALDISNLDDVKVASRTYNTFDMFDPTHPPILRGYFECVDESRGTVIGWYVLTDTFATCKFN